MRKLFTFCVVCLLLTPLGAMGAPTLVLPGSEDEPALLDAYTSESDGWLDAFGVTHAMRVDDAIDQIFSNGGTTSIQFEALFWGGTPDNPGTSVHSFGYTLNNGSAVRVFTVEQGSGVAFDVASPFSIGTGDIRWWADNYDKDDEGYSSRAWSDSSMNNPVGATGSYDRMVTFDVTGTDLQVDNLHTYILCFDTGRDADYNDLIVRAAGPYPVPAPGAILLGSLGAGLVGWLRRRRSL